MSDYILSMKNIVKVFDGIEVLKNVDFELKKGEVHAIVGENGAGKTTLMNILTGQYRQNAGSIFIDGEEIEIENQKHAMNLGIAAVFQNDSLFENLNVAENIFANREPRHKLGFFKIVNWKSAYQKAAKILQFLKIDVAPDVSVRQLTFAERKFVEIARAIISEAKIVVLDEPTAAFTKQETEFLFSIVRNLKSTGVSIIYISHRYDELFKIADRVTILRDGRTVAVLNREEINASSLFKMIVGEEIKNRYPKLSVKLKEEVMIVKNLGNEYIKNISFSLRRGEILGIYGIRGSGKTSLARALFGLDRINTGSVYIKGRLVNLLSTQKSSENGIAYIPTNRFDKGLILKTSIANNTVITFLRQIVNRMFLSSRLKTKKTLEYKEMLDIKYNDVNESIRNISGGNQKKVILSKWLLKNAQIIIMNEPTGSIDIQSKVDVYNIINELALSGVGIIFISSEIPELLGMCDRILIMRSGEIVDVVLPEGSNQEEIIRLASGQNI